MVLGNLSPLMRQLLRQKACMLQALMLHVGPERAACAECHVTAPALVSWSSVTTCPFLWTVSSQRPKKKKKTGPKLLAPKDGYAHPYLQLDKERVLSPLLWLLTN